MIKININIENATTDEKINLAGLYSKTLNELLEEGVSVVLNPSIETILDVPNNLQFSSECLDFLAEYLFEGSTLEKKENGSNVSYQISQGNKKIRVSKLLNHNHKKLCKKMYDYHLKKPEINYINIPLNEEERALFSELHRTLIDIHEGQNSISIALIQSWKKVGADSLVDDWTSIRIDRKDILKNRELYKRL